MDPSTSQATFEILRSEIKHLDEKLDEIIARQDKANGALGRHEVWIGVKDTEIEQIQDRLDANDDRYKEVERSIDGHQTYIDQRSQSIEEHNRMKQKLDGMHDYPELKHTVAKHSAILAQQRGRRQVLAEWSAILTPIIASVIGALLLMRH